LRPGKDNSLIMKSFPEDFTLGDGVWHPPVEDPIPYSDGDASEKHLKEALESAADLSSGSTELARAATDWPSEYHLSPVRANVLRPFALRKDARVLELGCGCGAVTRYLAENAGRVVAVEGSPARARLARMRCRGMDNVDIVAGNFDAVSFREPFDVVTLIGVLEYAGVFWRRAGEPFEETLRFARENLAPGGTLVVAIENKLGMKYFSGCDEDHLGRPFPGIEGYPDPRGPRTFGRQELIDLAGRCGFTDFELLLPFPDYKLPTAFLNARYCSARECREYNLADWCGEPFRDYLKHREHLFHDQLALASVAKTGLLADFANSFLLLASPGPIGESSAIPRPDWIAKKYNLLRRPEFRTVTTLLERDGKPAVVKVRANDVPPPPSSPIRLSLEAERPFVTGGTSLFFEMDRALRRTAGGAEEFAGLVARWAGFLRQRAIPGTDRLPPDCIDCWPANLILDPAGTLHYIDDEWRWHEPVPVDWVLLRGLLHFWNKRRPWVERFLGKPGADFGEFLSRGLSASGVAIGGKRAEELMALERTLLSAVFHSGGETAPEAGETALVARVEELFDAGETIPALTLAGEIAKKYPDNATNWNNLGVILNSLGKTGEARECLEVAASIDPRFADALAALQAPGKAPAAGGDAFRVVAILAVHNEGDIIRHSVGDLIRQGVSVYLLDNCSTDNTVEEASVWLGKGLIHIERFPDDAGYPQRLRDEFSLKEVLRRKEELAATLRADWFIHMDADEFREAPWPGLTLSEGIRVADSMGYNALQFAVFNFQPVDDGFPPGADVREYLKYYLPLPENATHAQVKAWKNLGMRPSLAETAGHEVRFEGRRICPTRFILRHYPLRGQRHGARKVFDERKTRFSPAARKIGWHTQYDHVRTKDHNFLRDPATLRLYDGNVARLQILSYQAFSTAEAALGEETVNRILKENWYDRRALRVERDVLKIW